MSKPELYNINVVSCHFIDHRIVGYTIKLDTSNGVVFENCTKLDAFENYQLIANVAHKRPENNYLYFRNEIEKVMHPYYDLTNLPNFDFKLDSIYEKYNLEKFADRKIIIAKNDSSVSTFGAPVGVILDSRNNVIGFKTLLGDRLYNLSLKDYLDYTSKYYMKTTLSGHFDIKTPSVKSWTTPQRERLFGIDTKSHKFDYQAAKLLFGDNIKVANGSIYDGMIDFQDSVLDKITSDLYKQFKLENDHKVRGLKVYEKYPIYSDRYATGKIKRANYVLAYTNIGYVILQLNYYLIKKVKYSDEKLIVQSVPFYFTLDENGDATFVINKNTENGYKFWR